MEYDMRRIMELARSPAGQQLMALLQQADQGKLRSAAGMASGGDLEGAKNQLAGLLESPQLQALLKQMEGMP